MSERRTFAAPILTSGLAGFPDALHDIKHAREVIEAARLPAIRSSYAWLDAHNRLMAAQVAPTFQHVEAARISLNFAILHERRGGRRPRRDRHVDRAMAA